MNVILFLSLSFAVILSILCSDEFKDHLVRKPCKRENEAIENNLITDIRELWTRELHYRIRIKRNNAKMNTSIFQQDPLEGSDVMKNISEFTNSSGVDKHALLVAKFKRLWPVGRWQEHGFFSEDYLELINEHWLQFDPPSEFLQKFLGGLYMLFTTVGCWGNITVLFMYFR